MKRYGATEAIATSTGQNDTGLFELNFRDERYLPFEYAGAVSRWRIELPIETNAFDIDSVSDLIFQLSYTARDGGAMLQKASWAAASCMLPGAGLRFFDWRQDFADTWQRFKATVSVPEPPDRTRALTLRMSRGMFPYLPGQRPVRMRRVELWFEAQGCDSVRTHEIEFVPGSRLRMRGRQRRVLRALLPDVRGQRGLAMPLPRRDRVPVPVPARRSTGHDRRFSVPRGRRRGTPCVSCMFVRGRSGGTLLAEAIQLRRRLQKSLLKGTDGGRFT